MDELPREALRRGIEAAGCELHELPSGAGHDAQIFALAGVPSAMLFVRSDAGGVSHAPEEHSGADAVGLGLQALDGGAARAGGRVTDWNALARPSLQGLVRYDPGPSRDALKARLGLDELEPLNWNEDRFEPPRRVLEAAAAEVFNAALYPERLFADFRDGLARWLELPPECITPAHGAQAVIAAITQVFVGPGTPVIAPNLTYGLYASVAAAADGSVTRVPPDGLALDLPAIAAAATAQRARLVWICDPNNPTGTLDRAHGVERVPREPARRLHRRRRRGLHGLRRSRAARRPAARRARRPPGDRRALVLEDLRSRRPSPRLRHLGPRGRAPARPRAGAVQRQSRGARRGHRGGGGARRSSSCGADRSLPARALLTAELEAAGIAVHPSQSNFVLVELGRDDGAVCDELMRRGILVRGGSEFGLPGLARVTVGPDALMRRTAAELIGILQATETGSA